MSNENEKKGSKAGKVILWIVGVIVALLIVAAIAVLGGVKAATTDTLPAAPSASDADLKTFAVDAAIEVVKDKTITVEAGDIDLILAQVKDSVNSSTDLFEIKEMFSKLEGGKGIIYARVYVDTVNVKGIDIKLDKTLPLEIDYSVDFEAPEIIVIPESINCGKISFPMSIVANILDKVQLPENMRSENGRIYYDTSTLDSQIDEILSAQITDAVTNSEVIGFLGGIIGEDAASSLGNKIAESVSNIATDATAVELFDAEINEDKLVISGKVM